MKEMMADEQVDLGGSPSLSGGLGVRWRVSHWTDYLREAAEHLLFGPLAVCVVLDVEGAGL